MKAIGFAATVVICLTAFPMVCLAQDAPGPANVLKQGPEAKGPTGWILPFASQAMTDNLTPQKPTGTGGASTGARMKFDHISDDTPPHHGIAPQKSQK